MKSLRFAILAPMLLALASCQTLQTLAQSVDQLGAQLAQQLAATSTQGEAVEVEIGRAWPEDLVGRMQAGELRAGVCVSDRRSTDAAAELLQSLSLPRAGDPLLVPGDGADAEAWFMALGERAAAESDLPEDELLVAVHLSVASLPSSAAESGREVKLAIRAYHPAAGSWVFAASATAKDAEEGDTSLQERASRLAAAMAARLEPKQRKK